MHPPGSGWRAVRGLQVQVADELRVCGRHAFVAGDSVRALGFFEAVVRGVAEGGVARGERAAHAQQRHHAGAPDVGGDRRAGGAS
jgi:hypothetical protein